MAKWPGFTNTDEICPVCGLCPGSSGCSNVGDMVYILTIGGKGEHIMTSHSTSLDKVKIETD